MGIRGSPSFINMPSRGATFAPIYDVDKTRDLAGKTARCAVSDVPWKSSYAGKKIKITTKISKIGS